MAKRRTPIDPTLETADTEALIAELIRRSDLSLIVLSKANAPDDHECDCAIRHAGGQSTIVRFGDPIAAIGLGFMSANHISAALGAHRTA